MVRIACLLLVRAFLCVPDVGLCGIFCVWDGDAGSGIGRKEAMGIVTSPLLLSVFGSESAGPIGSGE